MVCFVLDKKRKMQRLGEPGHRIKSQCRLSNYSAAQQEHESAAAQQESAAAQQESATSSTTSAASSAASAFFALFPQDAAATMRATTANDINTFFIMFKN